MKKLGVALAAVSIALSMPVSAFAGCHKTQSVANKAVAKGAVANAGVANTTVANAYAVCWVEDCTLGYAHYHDDLYCLPHNALDGHGYHEACEVAGCSKIGVHTHYAGACHR